jgi:DNA-binding transcriptional ArsR family regulator
MSYLILKERRADQLLPTRVLSDPKSALTLLQPTRWRILNELTAGEKCAKELSEAFGASEQVVCYHLRELERAGFVHLERTEKKRGAMAKYYRADQKAITIVPKLAAPRGSQALAEQTLSEASSNLLAPFTSSGRFNGHIVLGSPDTHGPFRGRARCGDRATDLALFLGSLLPVTRESIVRLDTEISQQETFQNLIVVGGPKVNTLTMAVNQSLPVTYELTGHNVMVSRITGRSYVGEDEGAVQSIVNPMNPENRVIVLAGNTYQGTRAAVLAFIKYTDEVADGNSTNRNVVARVVSGLDLNSDGLIDDVEFLE